MVLDVSRGSDIPYIWIEHIPNPFLIRHWSERGIEGPKYGKMMRHFLFYVFKKGFIYVLTKIGELMIRDRLQCFWMISGILKTFITSGPVDPRTYHTNNSRNTRTIILASSKHIIFANMRVRNLGNVGIVAYQTVWIWGCSYSVFEIVYLILSKFRCWALWNLEFLNIGKTGADNQSRWRCVNGEFEYGPNIDLKTWDDFRGIFKTYNI